MPPIVLALKMNIAVFHGTGGSPTGNWFPWVQDTFGSTHTVTIPTLPTPLHQSRDAWAATTTAQVPNLDTYDVLIGHSCGASFLPHLILSQNLNPKTVIMVSAFSGAIGLPDYDALNKTFFLSDDLLHQFRLYIDQHHIRTILYHGDNDPYVPLIQAQHLAACLNTPLRIIQNGGHLNAEFGYTTFSELLEYI